METSILHQSPTRTYIFGHSHQRTNKGGGLPDEPHRANARVLPRLFAQEGYESWHATSLAYQ